MLTLTVNRRRYELDVAPPETPLLWVLRDTLGLTGTKYGCGKALCGACTGHVDAEPARSCAIPVGEMGRAYMNPVMGTQATGGSTAIRGFWTSCREVGAAAREILVLAAARRGGVDSESCVTEKGRVSHAPSGRTLRYGALVAEAARLPVPEVVFLKEPDEFRILGHPIPRVDTPQQVEGSAVFGQDVRLPEGRGHGIAVARPFGSYVAQVAEVSIAEGRVRVHRVVCAVDCGMIVNPDTIEAQMQSAIAFGLTEALMGEITLDRGRVRPGNFDDYPMLRMDQMPRVEVHIVSSDAALGGIGGPGTPPIAPAVANAVFVATGTPVRRLPIRLAS